MSGQWLMPDPAPVPLADVLGSPAFGIPESQRMALALALQETGYLVTTAYYVPDVGELFDMYSQLAEVDYHGRGQVPRSWLRWVMCRETQEALHRKYSRTKAVRAPRIDAFLATGDLIEPDALVAEIHTVMTMKAARTIPAALDAGRLFDMPIRRDPAARRPMFELIPPEERSNPAQSTTAAHR